LYATVAQQSRQLGSYSFTHYDRKPITPRKDTG
jgi:hypothetical protein